MLGQLNPSPCYRFRIPIHSNHSAEGPAVENRPSVSPAPQRAVQDRPFPGPMKRLENFLHHDGEMECRFPGHDPTLCPKEPAAPSLREPRSSEDLVAEALRVFRLLLDGLLELLRVPDLHPVDHTTQHHRPLQEGGLLEPGGDEYPPLFVR